MDALQSSDAYENSLQPFSSVEPTSTMSGVSAGIYAQREHQDQRKVKDSLRPVDELDPGMVVFIYSRCGLIHSRRTTPRSPCLSFWLGQARHSEILGLRTTADLPKEQDVTISKVPWSTVSFSDL